MPNNRDIKLTQIDSLRGVAILMVILTHVSPQTEGTLTILASLSVYGRMGVQLFFVVSALTLCMSMENRKDETFELRNFYIRRYFRIAPLYYLGIFFYTFLALLSSPNSSPNWGNILLHLTFLHGLSPQAFMNVVPGGWSIGVEFLFYFFFPFLYKAFSSRGWPALFALLAIAVAGAIAAKFALSSFLGIQEDPWTITYWNFLNQLPTFVLGMFIYKLITSGSSFTSKPLLAMAIFCVFTCLSLLLYYFKPPFHAVLIVISSGISFVGLYFVFANVRALNVKILGDIGRASFSMYLVHFAVVEFYFYYLDNLGLGINPNIMLAVNFAAVVTITYLISKYSERYIEQAGTQFAKRLIRNGEAKARQGMSPELQS